MTQFILIIALLLLAYNTYLTIEFGSRRFPYVPNYDKQLTELNQKLDNILNGKISSEHQELSEKIESLGNDIILLGATINKTNDDFKTAFNLNSINVKAKLDAIHKAEKVVQIDDTKLEPLIEKVVSYTIEVRDNMPIYVDATN